MTVLELISHWTEEERKQHAQLIAECLDREQGLIEVGNQLKESEAGLQRNLDRLLSGLRNLARAVDENGDQVREIYLRLAKGKGNA